MDAYETVLLTLGEMKGQLIEMKGEFLEIRKLNERIARLEMWQSWLKGGWAFLAYALIVKKTFGL
jgi:hypothetical protein